MRIRRSLSILLLTCLLGVVALPAAPVAAQNCATIGPGANLAGCNLSGLDLSGVNLAGANLRGANLEGANLDGANLSGANLSNARVTEGALDNANTSGANLRGIRWVPAPVPTNPPVLDPVVTVSISFSHVFQTVTYCFVKMELSHFGPDTTYTALSYLYDVQEDQLTLQVTTNSEGSFSGELYIWASDSRQLTVVVNGVQSVTQPIRCFV